MSQEQTLIPIKFKNPSGYSVLRRDKRAEPGDLRMTIVDGDLFWQEIPDCYRGFKAKDFPGPVLFKIKKRSK